jgi:hypothetical protein
MAHIAIEANYNFMQGRAGRTPETVGVLFVFAATLSRNTFSLAQRTLSD